MLLRLDEVRAARDAGSESGQTIAAPKSASCDLTIFEGADAVAQAETDWRSIAEGGGVPTPFQSFSLASAAARAHVRHNEVPRIVVVRRAGRATVIIPTVVTSFFGQRIVRFLGDPLIQYGDVLAGPNATSEDFAAAWSAAAHARVACLGLFRRVRDDAHAAKFLTETANVTSVQESPLIDVRQPSRLPAREARELRRLRRRLAEQGTLDFRVERGPEARELLMQALDLKRAWMKAQGLASKVIGNSDWERVLCRLCEAGSEEGGLAVAVLTVGGRVAAFEAAFVDLACWYAFLGAFSPEFARMGPGQVLIADCIAHCRDIGLPIYDQLPPSQPYKRRQATGAIAVRDYGLRLTPMGRLPLVANRMIPDIKSLLDAVPVGVRRPVLSLCGALFSRK